MLTEDQHDFVENMRGASDLYLPYSSNEIDQLIEIIDILIADNARLCDELNAAKLDNAALLKLVSEMSPATPPPSDSSTGNWKKKGRLASYSDLSFDEAWNVAYDACAPGDWPLVPVDDDDRIIEAKAAFLRGWGMVELPDEPFTEAFPSDTDWNAFEPFPNTEFHSTKPNRAQDSGGAMMFRGHAYIRYTTNGKTEYEPPAAPTLKLSKAQIINLKRLADAKFGLDRGISNGFACMHWKAADSLIRPGYATMHNGNVKITDLGREAIEDLKRRIAELEASRD